MPPTGKVLIFCAGNTEPSYKVIDTLGRRQKAAFLSLWTLVCVDRGLHRTRGADAYPRAE
jgi:hypothetical protein